jgi:phosphonate transport system substrate-binding protein
MSPAGRSGFVRLHCWDKKIYGFNSIIKLAFCGLILLLNIFGCATGPKAADAPLVDSRPLLKLGAIPSERAEKIQDQYQGFIDYLERRTGFRIELVVAQNYQGIIEKMGKKELDIALLGPFSYVIAHETAGARAFASPEYKLTGSNYTSNIITHAGTGITSLAQLKGHSFSFTDPESTSGYLIPKAALLKQKINPERDFSQILFLGHHDANVLAVKKHTVDAAAVSSNVLKSLLAKGIVDEDEIKILFTSAPIPQSVWAYREDLPADLMVQVKQAFFNAHIESGALGIYAKDVNRFVPRDDAAYNIIRETARLLNYKPQ